MNDNNYIETTISDRLKKAVRYLKRIGEIKDQKDLAQKMGTSPVTVSRSLTGVYKGEKFARDLNSSFGCVFSDSWLLHGIGDMLATKTEIHPITHPQIIGELPELTRENIPAIVPLPSGAGDTIPDWADSLIYRVSENTKALETLLKENASLRKDMAAMRAEIKQLRADLGAALHHPAIYNQEQEPLPMAAESSSNIK